MKPRYVTTDTSGLKEIRGLGTGKNVLVNADPEGRVVLLREPTEEEIKEAIEDYYLRRAQHWWDRVMMSVCADKQSSYPPQKCPFANGFRALLAKDSQTGRRTAQLSYLRHPFLRRHLPDPCPSGLVDYFVSLPLAEQMSLLEAFRPTSRDSLLDTLGGPIAFDNVYQFDFFGCLDFSGSPVTFVDTIIRILHGDEEGLPARAFRKRDVSGFLQRSLEFLGLLHQKKWLLLNKRAFLSLPFVTKSKRNFNISAPLGQQSYWNADAVNLISGIVQEFGQSSSDPDHNCFAYKRLCLLLRSSTIEDIGDFSPELLAFNESRLELIRNSTARCEATQLTHAIIRSYKKDPRYSHVEFPVTKQITVGRLALKRSAESLRSRGFRWALASHPEYVTWVEVFEEYTKYIKLQWADRLYLHCNRWLDFLSELENPPLSPEEVDRAKHIRNVRSGTVNTFWLYLNKNIADPNIRNNALGVLRRFFDYYHDKLVAEYEGPVAQAPRFENPIKREDRWSHLDRRRKTHRYALGAELLDLLREVILDKDQNGVPTFNWAKNHPCLARDWQYEVDPETRETKKVWWPGRAIAMYLLLALPLRSFQVRWLDDGIADEYIYDFDSQRLIPNPRPYAEAGRQEGVFRLVQDPFHASSFLGLWVNTNKTKLYNPAMVRGYEIPWPDDELFSVLRVIIAWNAKYFPNPKPVTFADDNEMQTTEAVKPFLPKFYALFRDKRGFQGRDPNLPINYEKIKRIWCYLLAEAEFRLKAQGKNIELVTWVLENGNKGTFKRPRAKFDLHSLRVSGITSLIEKGVPVHIVSEYIAGHTSIVMTLYYEKTSLFKVREMLLQAQENAEADLDGCLTLLEQIDNPESILVWNAFDRQDNSAPDALRANKGLWQVDLSGICPGTLCEEGGPLDGSGKATPVPTGACGLCRYYITGPAFLYGQMLKLNNLMYSMREKGEELRSLRRGEIDLEDSGSKRALSEARGRRERIERELKDMTGDWCNRYRLFQASLARLDEYQEMKGKSAEEDGLLMPLLTASTQDEFKLMVTEATNVGLVRQISFMHEILGSFDLHKGPVLEYEKILDTILVRNNFEALLLTIPKDKRLAAANLLGEFLINSIDEDNLHRLFEGKDTIPETLHDQTRELLEYLKSDKFLVESPTMNPTSRVPRQLVQIRGLKA